MRNRNTTADDLNDKSDESIGLPVLLPESPGASPPKEDQSVDMGYEEMGDLDQRYEKRRARQTRSKPFAVQLQQSSHSLDSVSASSSQQTQNPAPLSPSPQSVTFASSHSHASTPSSPLPLSSSLHNNTPAPRRARRIHKPIIRTTSASSNCSSQGNHRILSPTNSGALAPLAEGAEEEQLGRSILAHSLMGLALQLTSQEWSQLGQQTSMGSTRRRKSSDSTHSGSSSSQEESAQQMPFGGDLDFFDLVERVTALLLVRILAVAAPARTFPDLSTLTICRTVLVQPDSWPPSVTRQVLHELQAYVTQILSWYRPYVPYHNAEHAYHVTVSTNKLLDLMLGKHFGQKIVPPTFGLRHDPLQLLSIMWAALVHDVDHHGVPNRQLATDEMDHPLAIRYNDQSIAENQSLFLAFDEFLHGVTAGSAQSPPQPRYQTLRNIMCPTKRDYLIFRRNVINLVLNTDIASPEKTQLSRSKFKEACFGGPPPPKPAIPIMPTSTHSANTTSPPKPENQQDSSGSHGMPSRRMSGSGAARRMFGDGQAPRRMSGGGVPTRRMSGCGVPPRRMSGGGVPPRRMSEDGQAPRSMSGGGAPPRRMSGGGAPPRRMSGDGQAPRRMSGDGQAPRRMSGDGQAPRRMSGDGQAPRRMSGDGQPPRRMSGDGQALRRMSGDGQALRRMSGDGQAPPRRMSGDGQAPPRRMSGDGQTPPRRMSGGGGVARRRGSNESRVSTRSRKTPKRTASNTVNTKGNQYSSTSGPTSSEYDSASSEASYSSEYTTEDSAETQVTTNTGTDTASRQRLQQHTSSGSSRNSSRNTRPSIRPIAEQRRRRSPTNRAMPDGVQVTVQTASAKSGSSRDEEALNEEDEEEDEEEEEDEDTPEKDDEDDEEEKYGIVAKVVNMGSLGVSSQSAEVRKTTTETTADAPPAVPRRRLTMGADIPSSMPNHPTPAEDSPCPSAASSVKSSDKMPAVPRRRLSTAMGGAGGSKAAESPVEEEEEAALSPGMVAALSTVKPSDKIPAVPQRRLSTAMGGTPSSSVKSETSEGQKSEDMKAAAMEKQTTQESFVGPKAANSSSPSTTSQQPLRPIQDIPDSPNPSTASDQAPAVPQRRASVTTSSAVAVPVANSGAVQHKPTIDGAIFSSSTVNNRPRGEPSVRSEQVGITLADHSTVDKIPGRPQRRASNAMDAQEESADPIVQSEGSMGDSNHCGTVSTAISDKIPSAPRRRLTALGSIPTEPSAQSDSLPDPPPDPLPDPPPDPLPDPPTIVSKDAAELAYLSQISDSDARPSSRRYYHMSDSDGMPAYRGRRRISGIGSVASAPPNGHISDSSSQHQHRRSSAGGIDTPKKRSYRTKRLGIRRSMDLSGEMLQQYHSSKAEFMALNEDKPDELKASVVLETIMTAADISQNLQSWNSMVKWSNKLYMELRRAHVAGKGPDVSRNWYRNQIGFLEMYVLPLARKLDETGVFGPMVGPSFARLVEVNRDRWKAEGEQVTAAVVEKGKSLFPDDTPIPEEEFTIIDPGIERSIKIGSGRAGLADPSTFQDGAPEVNVTAAGSVDNQERELQEVREKLVEMLENHQKEIAKISSNHHSKVDDLEHELEEMTEELEKARNTISRLKAERDEALQSASLQMQKEFEVASLIEKMKLLEDEKNLIAVELGQLRRQFEDQKNLFNRDRQRPPADGTTMKELIAHHALETARIALLISELEKELSGCEKTGIDQSGIMLILSRKRNEKAECDEKLTKLCSFYDEEVKAVTTERGHSFYDEEAKAVTTERGHSLYNEEAKAVTTERGHSLYNEETKEVTTERGHLFESFCATENDFKSMLMPKANGNSRRVPAELLEQTTTSEETGTRAIANKSEQLLIRLGIERDILKEDKHQIFAELRDLLALQHKQSMELQIRLLEESQEKKGSWPSLASLGLVFFMGMYVAGSVKSSR